MKKTPLLLLPGTLCNQALWAPQMEALQDIAEPAVMDVGRYDSLEVLAESILQEAPERFALAGLSFGGILAFELYRQAPERITHLALLDTNARPDSADGIAAKREQLDYAASNGLEALLRNKLMPNYLAACNLGNESIVQTIVDMALERGEAVFHRQVEAVIKRPNSRSDLANIQCPTLVVCGREDIPCPPDRHWEIADAIPGAQCTVLENCGHFSTLEQPGQVSALMRAWLKQPGGHGE